MSALCPLYPQKRTFERTMTMSAKGQKRTWVLEDRVSIHVLENELIDLPFFDAPVINLQLLSERLVLQ
jgi:hypothetical protein